MHIQRYQNVSQELQRVTETQPVEPVTECVMYQIFQSMFSSTSLLHMNNKGKVRPTTGHKGPDG